MPKRRRIESDSPHEGLAGEPQAATSSTATTPATRSSLWLDDGNIILQAEDKQFKVHQGYLARLSPIFADVFSMPQPANGPQLDLDSDGCPVLYLQDSAEDLSVALSEIYDHCYSPRDRVRIDVVFAMIRIGRKYEIQHLLKEGIARLQAEFPATLDAHDNIADTISWNGIIDNDEVGSGVLFGIANFCTTHSDMKELLPLLPLAYYWVNCRNLLTILDGDSFEGEEGAPTLLSPEVQKICLRGRQKLIDQFSPFFAWVERIGRVNPFGATPHPRRCSGAIDTLTNLLWKPEPQLHIMLDPWVSLEKQLALRDEVCDECYAFARKSHNEARERLWDDLPEFFGLPSWDVLNAGT